MKLRFLIFVLSFAGLAFVPAAASASPWIHAHRGGPIESGKGAMPENSMPAFRQSAARGFVLEADVKLTSDKVPVIIHDDDLDRTTDAPDPLPPRPWHNWRVARST